MTANPETDPTAYVEVLARLLCAADVHVHGDEHPTWQHLVGETGSRIRDDYRAAARWLAARLTVAPAVVSSPPATDRATVLREEAALIRAHCPDHLDSESAEGSWISCHCDVADDMERRGAEAQPETDTETQGSLPDRLEAALTERFTSQGNPFSEMRRHEQGPDGWPASHPVGPRLVAEVLRELLADAPRPSIHLNDVQGFCPACGHPTLYVGAGGHLTCSLMDCPKPEAADELLRATAAGGAGGVADRVVAYRSAGGRALRCLQHRPSDDAFANGDFYPVTSEDLSDGGVCTFPVTVDVRCGVDVLIPQKPQS